MAEGIKAAEKRIVKREFTALESFADLKNCLADSARGTYEKAELELETAKKEYEAMCAALEEKTQELACANVKLVAEQIEAEKQKEAFQKEYEKYQDSKEELDKLREQIRTSYSTDDISSFLNDTIKKFNDEHSSDSDIAHYVINSMDVELKVRIYDESKTDEGKDSSADSNAAQKLKFIAPAINETSEDSLSSIKITIQAVPK